MREKPYVERDGKIYALVSFTNSKGKRQQIWRKAESKTDAREIARQIRKQLEEGTEPFEHRGKLDEYLDKWLATSKQKVSPNTYEGYVGLMRLYVRPTLGEKELAKLKPLHIQELINSMCEKGLSARTVRYTHAILFRALKQAIKWRMLTHNPAVGVELPKQTRKEMKCLSPQEAQVFLAECAKDKYGLLFELALVTGMRPEEYLGLLWSDIDFQKETLTIQRVLVWKRWKTEWYFDEPKTARSRRTIPLPSYLVKELEAYRRTQLERIMKFRKKWQEYNLVFPADYGTPLSVRNLARRHFKPILVKAGLPDIRLYDLRHSCATLLLAAGENPKVVSERLGHASIVLTLDTYSHVLPSMQKSATENMVKILGRG